MLKMTVISGAVGTTLKLEGVLSGPDVDELDRCCGILQAIGGGRPLCVDLTDLMSASPEGMDLLDLLRRDGLMVVEGDRRFGRSSIASHTAQPAGRSSPSDSRREGPWFAFTHTAWR